MIFGALLFAAVADAHRVYRAVHGGVTAANMVFGDIRTSPEPKRSARPRVVYLRADDPPEDPPGMWLTPTERDVLRGWVRALADAACMLREAGEEGSPLFAHALSRCDDFRSLLARDPGDPSTRPDAEPSRSR